MINQKILFKNIIIGNIFIYYNLYNKAEIKEKFRKKMKLIYKNYFFTFYK